MHFSKFAAASLLALSTLALAAQSTQPSLHRRSSSDPSTDASSKSIKLDVVVEANGGLPVTTLLGRDFTVFDNKKPRPVTSFGVNTPKTEPVEVILVLDAVNTPYELLAQVRNGADKYFKANEGSLGHPTTFAVLTDDGLQYNNRFSSDGNKLSSDLEGDRVGFRQIFRGTQWGPIDRLNIGITAIHQVVGVASRMPGRKIVLFISPGFPLLSGPGVQLNSKQQRQIFSDTVYLTNQLRQDDITFYIVNPIGVSQSMYVANYYENFLTGLVRPEDAQFAYLSPQVLSPQSGGLTLISNNDIPGMIQRCLRDAASWYQISFDPLPSAKPNEYHHIEVRVAQPHAVVRTRDGYYANATPISVR